MLEQQRQEEEEREQERLRQEEAEYERIGKQNPIIFMVQYIQDFQEQMPAQGDGPSNLFCVPDESFELDLDNNFVQAESVLA